MSWRPSGVLDHPQLELEVRRFRLWHCDAGARAALAALLETAGAERGEQPGGEDAGDASAVESGICTSSSASASTDALCAASEREVCHSPTSSAGRSLRPTTLRMRMHWESRLGFAAADGVAAGAAASAPSDEELDDGAGVAGAGVGASVTFSFGSGEVSSRGAAGSGWSGVDRRAGWCLWRRVKMSRSWVPSP